MMNNYLIIEFADCRVDVGANTLTKPTAIEQLTPKTMDVLVYLLTNANRTVSIDDILSECWRGRVTTTNVVHKAISELRKALKGDSAVSPALNTIHGRGYRLCVSTINLVD